MNTRFALLFGISAATAIFPGVVIGQSVALESKAKTGALTVSSNAVPQSVFTIPANFSEGRDPFYPNARYMFGTTVVHREEHRNPGIDQLHLDGIAGTKEHKLAMINFRTMAEGETNNVLTASGTLRFRCVEIKSDSVTVEVIGGERRVLRLRD